MLTRSQFHGLGMKQEDFTKAFLNALKDKHVIEQLQTTITADLQREITDLRECIHKKDKQIEELHKKINNLYDSTDKLEQYSRRNSLRVFGIPEGEHEDPADIAFDLVNKN